MHPSQALVPRLSGSSLVAACGSSAGSITRSSRLVASAAPGYAVEHKETHAQPSQTLRYAMRLHSSKLAATAKASSHVKAQSQVHAQAAAANAASAAVAAAAASASTTRYSIFFGPTERARRSKTSGDASKVPAPMISWNDHLRMV